MQYKVSFFQSDDKVLEGRYFFAFFPSFLPCLLSYFLPPSLPLSLSFFHFPLSILCNVMLCYVHKMLPICLNKTRTYKQQPMGHILPYLSCIKHEHSHDT